jgi:hypothetical protein
MYMAMLVKTGENGRVPGAFDLDWHREPIPCTKANCKVSYTYLYRDAEIRIDLTKEPHENVVVKMRREATKEVNNEHPGHVRQTYIWDESKWAQADSVAARA